MSIIRNQYDVVIVGAGLAGQVAATWVVDASGRGKVLKRKLEAAA
jgi:succinate dehydrogenase/fumarate reductase flavoprotein subunit